MRLAAAALALYGPRALRERAEFALRARFQPATGGKVALIATHPVILFGREWVFRPGAPIYRLLEELRDRPVQYLCCLSWNYDTRLMAGRLLRLQRRVNRRRKHDLLVLANSAEQQARFEQLGVASIFVSSLAQADESVYRPLPESEIRYDAIYDARLSPFKRHNLAAGIANLALVVDPAPKKRIVTPYLEEIRPVLARAHVLNRIPGSEALRKLPPREVNECLNQSAVGLCLSRVEGAMRASIQYLLAGLPVVSTPSFGGRDEFFDPDYVEIVEPTPEAVAGGVLEMKQRGLDPREIRARTLAKLQPHRDRFADRLEAICQAWGAKRLYRAPWPEMFGNTLHLQKEIDIDETLSQIRAADQR